MRLRLLVLGVCLVVVGNHEGTFEIGFVRDYTRPDVGTPEEST